MPISVCGLCKESRSLMQQQWVPLIVSGKRHQIQEISETMQKLAMGTQGCILVGKSKKGAIVKVRSDLSIVCKEHQWLFESGRGLWLCVIRPGAEE